MKTHSPQDRKVEYSGTEADRGAQSYIWDRFANEGNLALQFVILSLHILLSQPQKETNTEENGQSCQYKYCPQIAKPDIRQRLAKE